MFIFIEAKGASGLKFFEGERIPDTLNGLVITELAHDDSRVTEMTGKFLVDRCGQVFKVSQRYCSRLSKTVLERKMISLTEESVAQIGPRLQSIIISLLALVNPLLNNPRVYEARGMDVVPLYAENLFTGARQSAQTSFPFGKHTDAALDLGRFLLMACGYPDVGVEKLMSRSERNEAEDRKTRARSHFRSEVVSAVNLIHYSGETSMLARTISRQTETLLNVVTPEVQFKVSVSDCDMINTYMATQILLAHIGIHYIDPFLISLSTVITEADNFTRVSSKRSHHFNNTGMSDVLANYDGVTDTMVSNMMHGPADFLLFDGDVATNIAAALGLDTQNLGTRSDGRKVYIEEALATFFSALWKGMQLNIKRAPLCGAIKK